MTNRTPQVELVYEQGCPNIAAAREQLLRAFDAAGLTPRWSEWDVAEPDAPERVRGYGSPTILIDGDDVAPETANEASCCRVYADSEASNKGVPPLARVVSALGAGQSAPGGGGGTGRGKHIHVAALPSVGLALLPKLTCPACWPAYAGLLSSLGLGFVDYTPYLLPLTGLFLAVTLAGLFSAARRRGRRKALALGAAAAGLVLVGKFGFDSEILLYAGIGLLVAASLWAGWPLQAGRPTTACPACTTPVRGD
ncbi:MAG TPA: MerC family mercury resistance protein [Gammaproteobacteria bacterium]|nr:MerC family mercury resistance protein [Gammaproteobacteria bacterium]